MTVSTDPENRFAKFPDKNFQESRNIREFNRPDEVHIYEKPDI